MSAPADPSYNSALKWAQENSNKTTRSGSEDYFSWLFLGIIILIIIVGYFCLKNINSTSRETGALGTLEPNGNNPRMILDGVGRVGCRRFLTSSSAG